MSSIVTASVLVWPCTTVPSESPTRMISSPASSTMRVNSASYAVTITSFLRSRLRCMKSGIVMLAQLGLRQDIGQSIDRLDRHNMDAVAMRPERLDRSHRDVHADGRFARRAGRPQLGDQLVRHRNPGNVRVQELGHLRGPQQKNPGQDFDLEMTDPLHEGREALGMVD